MDQCQAWRRPCGLETIDRRNGREPRSLKEIRYYDRCCRDQYYDSKRQLCCFGNLVLLEKPGDTCCGSRKYNVHTELCCGFTVKKKTVSQNACCGAVPYDSRRYTCCGGTVTPRASSHQHLNSCCGYVCKQLAIFFGRGCFLGSLYIECHAKIPKRAPQGKIVDKSKESVVGRLRPETTIYNYSYHHYYQ